MDSSADSADPVASIQSGCCGGRQPAASSSAQPDCIDATAAQLSRAIESRWVSGVRVGHGQGAGRATAVEADGEGCPDALERYVRAACVSPRPPVHESSHGKCSLTPAAHRLSGCATHSKVMALSLPIDKLVWLCWSRASAARQALAQSAL